MIKLTCSHNGIKRAVYLPDQFYKRLKMIKLADDTIALLVVMQIDGTYWPDEYAKRPGGEQHLTFFKAIFEMIESELPSFKAEYLAT